MNSRAILLSGTLLLSLTNLAQNFDGFNYQAVVRNAAGDPLPSQAVGVQVIIVSGILQPHVEVHSVTTDAHGLIKLVIGEGQLQSGPAFSAINWQDNTAWTCCVAVDITGGTNYAVLGCETFKAVPFALRALTSDSGPPTGWSLNGPMLSNTNAGNVGIGTTSPSAKLDVEGSFQLKDGSQGAQRILTSDADGNASWSNLSAESIFGSGNVPGGDISCLQLIYSLALDHTPYTVAVSDDKAYVINHALDRMEVIDVSNPTDPNLIGHVGVGTNTFLPSISGEYAYLVDYFNHDLKVVDISDPANPTTVATSMTSTYPFDIEVSGNYAYVVGNSPTTLQVFDISNPVVPFPLGSVAVTSDNGSLRASGQLVFLLAQNLFEVIDVSDPASPVVSGSLALNDALGQDPPVVSGTTVLFLANVVFPPYTGTLNAIDVSDPSNPALLGTLAIGNVPTGLARSGDHVFVTDRASDDLKVIDISDPANLAVVASLALGDLPADVAISGNYAYVLDNDQLKIIQLFCPNMITMDPVTGELTSQAITESDPQVGANTTDRVPKWDGSALVSGTIADVAGKVGIGTTAPVSKLDVEGGLAVGAAYSGTSAAPANGAIIEGNVGIGTTAPEHKLDVNGIVRIKDHLTFNSANGVVNWGPSGNLFFRSLNAVGDITGYNDRMTITSNGLVGIGTNVPAATADIMEASNAAGAMVLRLNNPSNRRLEVYSPGSDINEPWTFDTPNSIKFRADGSDLKSLYLDPNGNVGIGTSAPVEKLDVGGRVKSSVGYTCKAGTAGGYGGNAFNFFWTGAGLQAWVDNVNVGTVQFTSDRRLKEHISPISTSAIDRVKLLKPVTYNYRKIEGSMFTGDDVQHEGFIADELQAVIPSAVNGEKDARTADGGIQPQTVNSMPVISVLTKAIQEQQALIEEQRARIVALEAGNTAKDAALDAIRAQLDANTALMQQLQQVLSAQTSK